MTNDTAAGAASTGEAAGWHDRDARQESTMSGLLRERSRRITVTSVLDMLIETGGQFAERRADGSGWSVAMPASGTRYEASRR